MSADGGESAAYQGFPIRLRCHRIDNIVGVRDERICRASYRIKPRNADAGLAANAPWNRLPPESFRLAARQSNRRGRCIRTEGHVERSVGTDAGNAAARHTHDGGKVATKQNLPIWLHRDHKNVAIRVRVEAVESRLPLRTATTPPARSTTIENKEGGTFLVAGDVALTNMATCGGAARQMDAQDGFSKENLRNRSLSLRVSAPTTQLGARQSLVWGWGIGFCPVTHPLVKETLHGRLRTWSGPGV